MNIKRTTKVTIFILLASLCVSMSSCGSGDDDNNYSNDEGNSASKRIVKIVEEDGGSIYERTFSYDSQGRVIKVVEIENGNSTSTSETNYQYGEQLIISKMVENGKYSSGQNYTRLETHTYTVSNQLIVKDVEVQGDNSHTTTTTTTYSYDSNGYLSSSKQIVGNYSSTSYTSNYVWTNGNLTSIEESHVSDSGEPYPELSTYSYSNVVWNQHMIYYIKGSNMDGCLWMAGYWGKHPKNMPSNYDSSYFYEYTVTSGLVTKATVTYPGKGHEEKAISTITWE
jgi:hypothetical protein